MFLARARVTVRAPIWHRQDCDPRPGGAYVPLTRREMSLDDDAVLLSRVVNATRYAQHVRKHVSSNESIREYYLLPSRCPSHP